MLRVGLLLWMASVCHTFYLCFWLYCWFKRRLGLKAILYIYLLTSHLVQVFYCFCGFLSILFNLPCTKASHLPAVIILLLFTPTLVPLTLLLFQLNYFVLLEEVFNNLLFLTLSRIFLEEDAPDASPALHPLAPLWSRPFISFLVTARASCWFPGL